MDMAAGALTAPDNGISTLSSVSMISFIARYTDSSPCAIPIVCENTELRYIRGRIYHGDYADPQPFGGVASRTVLNN